VKDAGSSSLGRTGRSDGSGTTALRVGRPDRHSVRVAGARVAAKRRAARCRWIWMTTIEDRVRAARGQAGYKRREDRCADIQLPRFGARVLGQIERGERVLYRTKRTSSPVSFPLTRTGCFTETPRP
jgi:hypothetical protein